MSFEDNRLLPSLFGESNRHLLKIEKALKVGIDSRGNELIISGNPQKAGQARQIIEALWTKLQHGQEISPATVDSALRFLDDHSQRHGGWIERRKSMKDFTDLSVSINIKKKVIAPRSPMQSMYMEALQTNTLTLSLGPAGTGKTYLAVAHAVAMLEASEVERIILSRPAVEAGERLGFLPGEMKEKMDPYMRPLYDALQDTMNSDKMMKRLASEEIEIAPLAFMRGRTLNNSFIIRDEAQNATETQIMMFLTRHGEGSNMVITGDPSQTDLPRGEKSGLVVASKVLNGIDNTAVINFTSRDVIRSKLVSDIIKAYENHNKNKKSDD